MAYVEGRTVGNFQQQSPNTLDEKLKNRLVGEANEATVTLDGIPCPALLDTGSTVSTISQPFYEKHMKDSIPLHSLEEVLKIECADGKLLPYLGYVEATVSIPDTDKGELTAIFLVCPLTDYSSQVPVLLGTNVLRSMMDQCQEQEGKLFLQKMSLTTPWWLTFRGMSIRERELRRSEGRLALVKCASAETITIPANRSMLIPGMITDSVPCDATMAMTHPTKKTLLPDGAEVMPTLTTYDDSHASDETLLVEIANSSRTPIIIQPRALLCELQQVERQDVESPAPMTDEPNPLVTDEPSPPTTDVPNPDDVENSEEAQTEQQFLGQFSLEDEDLTPDQIKMVHSLLLQYRDIFSKGDFDIGQASAIKHRIDVTNGVPFKQRHRHVPPSMYEEVKNHLQQLLEKGIIKESSSPWSSGVVLVRKKNGKLRFCVDYRQLNQRTVKDSYALPRIEEITDNLKGSKYFTTLDMRSGFYQVEIEEEHKPLTAFTVGPLGFYQFERMPFGLSNSPATFQRLMERAMGDLNMHECFTYVDDTIVHGRTFEEHLERLRHVFEKVRQNQLKLNPEKCVLFKKKIQFCGHVVTEAGVETDPEKTARIAEWPAPENADQLREFLGFANYYRRYVKGFSTIAKPLTSLLGGKMGKKGKGRRRTAEGAPEWKWGQDQEEAFNCLKKHLTSPPVLAYPDYTQPFILHTDASGVGLGAVLCQEQQGQERVIAYASRGLSQSEKNYPAHKLEYLALKWAVTDKLNDYLYGNKFTVLTDNNPLTYVLTSAKLDATGHRWLAALSAYDFNIKYRPGVHNSDADALSRLPKRLVTEREPEEYREVSREAVTSLCKAQTCPVGEALCLSAEVLESEEFDVDITMDPRQMRVAQRNDPVIGAFYPYVSQKMRPKQHNLPVGAESRVLLREIDRLVLKRGVMYRKTEVDDREKLQIVLPKEYRPLALKGLHDDIGHLGRDKTLELVRDRYYWPRMTAEVEEKVKTCDRCLRRKTPTNIRW